MMNRMIDYREYKSIKINCGSNHYPNWRHFDILKVTSKRVYITETLYFTKKEINKYGNKTKLLKRKNGKADPERHYRNQEDKKWNVFSNAMLFLNVPILRRDDE